jgi:hypothetical protein
MPYYAKASYGALEAGGWRLENSVYFDNPN